MAPVGGRPHSYRRQRMPPRKSVVDVEAFPPRESPREYSARNAYRTAGECNLSGAWSGPVGNARKEEVGQRAFEKCYGFRPSPSLGPIGPRWGLGCALPSIRNKNVPPRNQVPWPFALNSGCVLLLWPNGRAAIQLLTGTPDSARAVEKMLEERFSARWQTKEAYTAEVCRKATCIRYGAISKRAEKSQSSGFRPGGKQ